MSGGVDSSVAAHILQQRGFAVHGVFITIRNPAHIPCTAAEDRLDAMRACAALKIPFLEYDATAVYQREIIQPFVDAYRRGDTPNPDILCNTHVKFGAVYDFVREKGFPAFATGHYARVREYNGEAHLCRAVDDGKDQTYFIYPIGREVLDTVLFPVGGYTKREVRARAAAARLPAAAKKDSTGLCFLGAVSMKDFLSAYLTPREGGVYLAEGCGARGGVGYGGMRGGVGTQIGGTDGGRRDVPVGDGEHSGAAGERADAAAGEYVGGRTGTRIGTQIGTHDGAWFYTIGQRHGFTVTAPDRGPYIVVGKDVERNVLFVCRQKDYTPTADAFRITDTVFRLPPEGELVARYRHRGELFPVSVRQESPTSATATFREPHLIAPGQSAVFYTHDGVCIGGGTVAHGVSP